MKLSEIGQSDIINYLGFNVSDLSALDLQFITTALKASINFIKSYTGLTDKTITGENVGVGDDITTTFSLSFHVITNQKIYIDGVLQTVDKDYTFDPLYGKIVFSTAPKKDAAITADYNATPADEFDDLTVAAYVLTVDMYDNRTMYVNRKDIVNNTVESILGLHSRNLL